MRPLNHGNGSRIDESRGKIVGDMDRQMPAVMPTSTFAGVRVISVDGNDVGRVLEIMADMRDGRIVYVVLAEGEFLGTGLTLRAIPWSALTLDIANECFRLDMSAQQVKDAPAFDGDNWPSMADAAWGQRMHKYYNRPPY
ncbi:PRC-barrel domain-containing protein [Paraburkholderia phymatum]|uniref:PRC-barrel domain-containing protein n=1 Tax=Paraburkholderia phymatum TaxID=148447 RepID=UPI003178D2A8